jgi:phosphate transport system substrate-binding protein
LIRNRRWASLIALLCSFSLLAAACGDDDDTGTASDDTTGTTAGGDEGTGGASGSVEISGSSTVEPIAVRVAELLEDVNPDITVNVDGPGTGDGFQLFCEGQTDISNASRAIKDSEAETCEANGVEYIELLIAQDGLTVMTNPANDTVECLSFADLYALMGPESSGVSRWSDAAEIASALGSSTEFPDAPLNISAPGAESGTYDTFVELALEGPYEERVESGDAPEDADPPIRNFPGQADDNIILQGIEGSNSSFGWVGFAFAEEAGDRVKEIAISEEPDGDCVEPSPETIADNSYPLSRPLYMYVSVQSAEENPAVAEYIDFLLDEGYAAVEEVGYVNLDDDSLESTRSSWQAR